MQSLVRSRWLLMCINWNWSHDNYDFCRAFLLFVLFLSVVCLSIPFGNVLILIISKSGTAGFSFLFRFFNSIDTCDPCQTERKTHKKRFVNTEIELFVCCWKWKPAYFKQLPTGLFLLFYYACLLANKQYSK